MVQVRDLTELKVRDLWREVKGEDEWWGDVKGETARLVKRLLESAMDEEILEHVRVRRHERSDTRRGYRNGYRRRSLLTEFGLLDAIRVPRDREGSYRPGVIPRYEPRYTWPGVGGPLRCTGDNRTPAD
jgi:transposase-like protein